MGRNQHCVVVTRSEALAVLRYQTTFHLHHFAIYLTTMNNRHLLDAWDCSKIQNTHKFIHSYINLVKSLLSQYFHSGTGERESTRKQIHKLMSET
jgi:hypothetical protein